MSDARASPPVWKNPVTVLVTGSSGGIGAALARRYARTGRTLILHGRDRPRLTAITRECEARGAVVVPLRFDLRDTEETMRSLRAVAGDHCIDLAIVNAGIAAAETGGADGEDWDAANEIFAVNVGGAVATVAAVLPAMRRRSSGQIALMSSLAAYYGLPITPVYCASKAALKAYGEALRGRLAPNGIAVNVILPGFVRTGMTQRFPRATPWIMSADQAAGCIERGLAHNAARLAFPPALAFGVWCLAVLPASWSERLVRAFGYGA